MFIIGSVVSFEKWDMEAITTFLLFLFYVAAFILSWFREKTAGYMFISWYVFMMALAIYVWNDAGMTIILGFPLLPIGVFYVLYAYRKDRDRPPEKHEQWKLVLRVLISAYAAIHLSGLGDIDVSAITDMMSVPYLYLSILLLVFLVAFAFSWKNELIAGILLLIWYSGVVIIARSFHAIPNEVGPMILMGFPVLVQAVLYLVYWFKFRPEEMLLSAGQG